MQYLVKKRKKIFVPANGSIEIRVDFESTDGESPRVWVQCSACGDEISENTKRKLFECPECGIEVTNAELNKLAQAQVDTIKQKFEINEERKGLIWRLATWFGRTKKLSAPKS